MNSVLEEPSPLHKGRTNLWNILGFFSQRWKRKGTLIDLY